jgi:hypothetical protein
MKVIENAVNVVIFLHYGSVGRASATRVGLTFDILTQKHSVVDKDGIPL